MIKTFELWDSEAKQKIEVEARKIGREWMAQCPMHEDRKPSLSINEEKGVFHCFSCDWSGKLYISDSKKRSPSNAGNKQFKDGEIVATYDYQDENGKLLFQKLRLPGKRFLQRCPDKNGGWKYKLDGVRKVPYRLPDILDENGKKETIFVVEGEKDANAMKTLGFLSTTSPNGAEKWPPEFNKYFKDRRVAILPDNDNVGQEYGQDVARNLSTVTEQIKLVRLPGLPEKGDVSDWLANGGTAEQLLQIVEETEPYQLTQEEGLRLNDSDSSAVMLLECLRNAADLTFFLDENGALMAAVNKGDYHDHMQVESESFKEEARRRFINRFRKIITKDPLRNVLSNIKSTFPANSLPTKNTFLRIAEYEGVVYYDLGTQKWETVKITKDGWEIANEAPVIFKRFPHMQPQVMPIKAPVESVKKILPFINVHIEELQILILVWLVSLFIPDISYPVLVLQGDHGSAKTSICKFLKSIVDPSMMEVLSIADKTVEIVQCLSHYHCIVLDNLSGISKTESDILCKAVTGEGFTKRELYSNDNDIFYRYKRALMLNSIGCVVTRPDLLDRSILIQCERFKSGSIKTEKNLLCESKNAKPEILGAIFSTIAKVLEIFPSMQFEESLPRMADFYCYGCAIAEVLNIGRDKFRNAYLANIASHSRTAIAEDPVAMAVVRFMETRPIWEGTATLLLNDLDPTARELGIDLRMKEWPKTPQKLANQLNIIKVNLSALGIKVDTGSWKGNEKIIKIYNDNYGKEQEAGCDGSK